MKSSRALLAAMPFAAVAASSALAAPTACEALASLQLARHDHHGRGRRSCGDIRSAGRHAADRHHRVPRRRIDQADQRFEHRLRGVDAHERLEPQVPLGRRRRLRRRRQLRRHRRRAAPRLRRRLHRYRARRRQRRLRARPSGEGGRLRLARQAPAGGALEGHHPRVLRTARSKHSYFSSCSNGGRQALMEIQRFPQDYDGVLVGAPANDWTHLFAGFVWNEQALVQHARARICAPSKLAAVQAATLAHVRCDGRRRRWRGRGPAPLQVRSGQSRLSRGHRWSELSHAAAGDCGAQDHAGAAQSAHRTTDLPRLLHERRGRGGLLAAVDHRSRDSPARRCRASSATPSSAASWMRSRRPACGTSPASTSTAT